MANTTLTTYDPNSVQMIFDGIPISGFADGTFVSIEQTNDAFTLQVGSDGFSTRSKSNDNRGTVTFTLMQTSGTNDLLSSKHNTDLQSINGAGAIGPLLVKDLTGRTIIEAEKAWIRKFPRTEYAREATSREWVIETNNLVQVVAGN